MPREAAAAPDVAPAGDLHMHDDEEQRRMAERLDGLERALGDAAETAESLRTEVEERKKEYQALQETSRLRDEDIRRLMEEVHNSLNEASQVPAKSLQDALAHLSERAQQYDDAARREEERTHRIEALEAALESMRAQHESVKKELRRDALDAMRAQLDSAKKELHDERLRDQAALQAAIEKQEEVARGYAGMQTLLAAATKAAAQREEAQARRIEALETAAGNARKELDAAKKELHRDALDATRAQLDSTKKELHDERLRDQAALRTVIDKQVELGRELANLQKLLHAATETADQREKEHGRRIEATENASGALRAQLESAKKELHDHAAQDLRGQIESAKKELYFEQLRDRALLRTAVEKQEEFARQVERLQTLLQFEQRNVARSKHEIQELTRKSRSLMKRMERMEIRARSFRRVTRRTRRVRRQPAPDTGPEKMTPPDSGKASVTA